MRNFIVGNWKMHKTRSEIEQFFRELNRHSDLVRHCEAWVAPQFIHLDAVKQLAQPLQMLVGGQNCAMADKGAFTGEVSPVSLSDMGASFVVLGHSDRRTLFHETDEVINQKTHLAIKAGLTVIFCCGETLAEREKGEAISVVRRQVTEGLKGISSSQIPFLMVAYEPVWAIGTGKTATSDQAQEMHSAIRQILVNELKMEAKELPILYGGSVKPSNVEELLAQQDINGALVGGASLEASDYLSLCRAAIQ